MKKLKVTVDGKVYEVEVEILDQSNEVPASSGLISAPAPAPSVTSASGGQDVPSPLSAVVVSIQIKTGDSVNEGDQLITLEAMKMNTYVTAPATGTVGEILVSAGDTVDEGQALLKLN